MFKRFLILVTLLSFSACDQRVTEPGSSLPSATKPSFAYTPRWGQVYAIEIPPGALNGVAVSINNAGHIVGWNDPGGNDRGFLWKDGILTNLGTLPSATESRAYDINNSGQIVGVSGAQAFLWQNGTMTQLPGLTSARAINDLGLVVGNQGGRAALYENGLVTLLPLLPGTSSSEALDINNSGQVIGTSGNRAFLWQSGTAVDLGSLDAGSPVVANGINNNGQIVGSSGNKAFLWQAGVMTALPPLADADSARAYGINDDGLIVGYSFRYGECPGAVLWRDGLVDCQGSYQSQSLSAALSINSSNQMAGISLELLYLVPTRWDDVHPTRLIPPVAVANGPYAGNEGANIAFTAAGSSDPGNLALKYKWTFGDGTISSKASLSKKYTDNGVYPVRLIVSNTEGAADTVFTTATIQNVAPTGTVTIGSSLFEGASHISVDVKPTDLGTADRATLETFLDCGLGAGYQLIGTGVTAILGRSCPALPDQGTRTLLVKVRDKDGAETVYTKVVQIRNARPAVTLSATSATTIPVGGNLSVSGAFTDAGVNDGPWSYTLNWADGSKSVGNSSSQGGQIPLSHTFTKAGTFLISFKVTDKDGATGSATLTVTVGP